MNMPRAVGTGIGDWAKGYSTSKQKGHKLNGALIYMPIVAPGVPGNVAITTPARVRFGTEKIPVKIVFGARKKRRAS